MNRIILNNATSFVTKRPHTLRMILPDEEKLEFVEKLNTLKTAYLTHRQIGASEAVYRVVPSMKLKDSNIKCIFAFNEYRRLCSDVQQ